LKNDWATQRLVQNRPRCCEKMWDQVLIEDKLKSRPDMNKVVTYYRFIFLLFAPPSLWFMLLGYGISRTADVAVIYIIPWLFFLKLSISVYFTPYITAIRQRAFLWKKTVAFLPPLVNVRHEWVFVNLEFFSASGIMVTPLWLTILHLYFWASCISDIMGTESWFSLLSSEVWDSVFWMNPGWGCSWLHKLSSVLLSSPIIPLLIFPLQSPQQQSYNVG